MRDVVLQLSRFPMVVGVLNYLFEVLGLTYRSFLFTAFAVAGLIFFFGG